MENDDEFVDIIGYEGLYQINRKGEVFSLITNNTMKPSLKKYGYYGIKLIKDRERKEFKLHRLLAIQFIPNPDNLPEIDHIDRNRQNHKLENLRWVDLTTQARNKENIINRQGHIQLSRTTKKGNYYQAEFYYDYRKRYTKCSYNLDELEKWLEEMRIQYPRI